MKTKSIKPHFSKLIHETEELISKNLMQVTSEKFSVLLVEEIWNRLDEAGKTFFLKNMVTYCKLKNAYEQEDSVVDPELKVMIKNKDQKVILFCRFKNDIAEFIDIP